MLLRFTLTNSPNRHRLGKFAVRAQTSTTSYIGRFAPSPSGRLHFGSAVAAIASYVQARYQGGVWHLRIDDLDPPREQSGAAQQILSDLESLGLEWDGPVVYQSQQSEFYDAALAALDTAGFAFSCSCTRKQLGGKIYPGTCRNGLKAGSAERTIRVKVGSKCVSFDDIARGPQTQNLATEVGDFVLRRADGYYAYHLAVVIDDARLGASEIVRGVDLLESTGRQIHLQHLFGYETPRYCHIPVVLNERGTKLSKQSFAKPIAGLNAADVLSEALDFLGFRPPKEIYASSTREILDWAIQVWDINAMTRLPREHRASKG